MKHPVFIDLCTHLYYGESVLENSHENAGVEKRPKELEDLTKNFLGIAEKDLEAAKILYRHKLYPHAVFYAEQCAEKVAKASLILCLQESVRLTALLLQEDTKPKESGKEVDQGTKRGDINKKLKDIGHDAVKLTRELCSCIESVLYSTSRYFSILKDERKPALEDMHLEALQNLAELFEEESEQIKETCTPILSWKPRKLLKLSRSEKKLAEYLKILEDVYEYAKIYVATIKPLVLVLGELSKFVSPIPVDTESILLRVSIGVKGAMLVGLLTILSPHVTRSRYPKTGFNPLNEYTESHPLIKHFDELIKLAETILKEE